MDEEGDSPQFWLHSAPTGDSNHRKPSSNFFKSNIFMLIVAIPALILLLVASSTSQILKQTSVRKSWDSLNVLLVLFAIVCGIFARWNEDVGSSKDKELEIPLEQVSDYTPLPQTTSPTSSYELRWYELSYDPQMQTAASSSGGLRRNSSSYPDLRQQSEWENTNGHGFRYYDDFEVSRFNQSRGIQPNGIISGRGSTRRNGDLDAKVIPVDTYSNQPDSAAKLPSLQDNPQSQPPRPPTTQQKKTRVHRSVPKRDRSGIENVPRATHQQPPIEDKGSSDPIKTGTSQTKLRRRKVRKDVPIKEETDTRSASKLSSTPAPPQSPPPVQLTFPKEEKNTRPAPDHSSQLNPPSPTKLPKATLTTPKQENEITNETKAPQLVSQSPSPPPPPPTPIRGDQNQKSSKKDKKKSSAKRELAMVWASIYKRKKKHNQPQQQQLGRADSGSYNGISQLFSEPEPEYISSSQLFPPPSPAPPPPPPPPPHSVFHSLFKKSGTNKSKKIHSVPAPPPPPPPTQRQTFIATPDNISQPRTSTGKPPLPKRQINNTKSAYEYFNNSGSQSPMFDIPRPPPLPPFGFPDTKFVVRGDYAKIKSNTSSRSGSPEPYVFDDEDESLTNEPVSIEKERATSSYCPSPDVNAKADTFIARLRGEWRLEKINSVNE